MEGYAQKTYISIINFPAHKSSDDKEEILTVAENLIIRQLNIKSNIASGLKYMIGETIDNITEHSETDRGFICAQAYKNKGYLDICIADGGVTLLGSYKNFRATKSQMISKQLKRLIEEYQVRIFLMLKIVVTEYIHLKKCWLKV